MVGCPIRIPADHIVCANPRSFSQLITSFFASESLGIPHTPLFCLLYFYLPHGRFCSFNELFNFQQAVSCGRQSVLKPIASYFVPHTSLITFLVFFVSNMSMNCLDPRSSQARIRAANGRKRLLSVVENIGVEPMTFPKLVRDALAP